jgi:hypothetical protein
MAFLGFGNFVGLLALFSLIPFLILFFIKPKAREMIIPSVMFLSRGDERKNKRSSFKNLVNDKLLLLQILIIGLIALFFAAPYLSVSTVGSGDVVFVLDTSASMEKHVESLKDSALDNIGARNTIIIVGSSPRIVLEGGDSSEAKKIIKKLGVSGSKSAITESLVLAKIYLDNIQSEKALFFGSDLIDTENGELINQLNEFDNSKIPIKLVDFYSDNKNNAGFIALDLKKNGKSIVVIKNFCCEMKSFEVSYEGRKKVVTLNVGASEEFEFDMVKGKSEINLLIEDEINGDNIIYLINDEREAVNVMLIQEGTDKYLESALDASGTVKFVKKSVNNIKKGYDVYILNKISSLTVEAKKILKEELNLGKSVIVIGSEEGSGVGSYGDFLNFDIGEKVSGGESKLTRGVSFTEGLSFGRHSRVRGIDCGISCQEYLVAGDQPVIFVKPFEKGLFAYYGVFGEDFSNRPDYPIFWTRFVRYLGGYKGLNEMNTNTGTIISFGGDANFKLPGGTKEKGNSLIMEESGFYEIENKIYSANVLNEEESNLERENLLENRISNEDVIQSKVKKNIWKELLIIGMFLLILEWIVSNRRIARRDYSV